MCIEVLRPHGQPPWVGGLLLVEDIECVRAGSKDSKTEYDDKTRESGLRKVKRCWVDLHVDGFTIIIPTTVDVLILKVGVPVCMAISLLKGKGICLYRSA